MIILLKTGSQAEARAGWIIYTSQATNLDLLLRQEVAGDSRAKIPLDLVHHYHTCLVKEGKTLTPLDLEHRDQYMCLT
jgi:hypothetical protein